MNENEQNWAVVLELTCSDGHNDCCVCLIGSAPAPAAEPAKPEATTPAAAADAPNADGEAAEG